MNIKYRKSRKEDIPKINHLFIELINTVNYESIYFYKNYGFKTLQEDGERLLITKDSNMSIDKRNRIIERKNIKRSKLL